MVVLDYKLVNDLLESIIVNYQGYGLPRLLEGELT